MDPALLTGLSPVVRLPPERRYLVLPADDRRALHTGLALLTACRARPLLMQSLARLAVRVAGCRAVPGRREEWQPGFGTDLWTSLLEEWETQLGRFDNLAVYERPQSFREGIAAVPLRRGRPVAVVKVRPGGEGTRERDVLAALDGAADGLRCPRVLATGAGSLGWTWLAMEYVATGVHRPAPLPDPRRLEDDLAAKLGDVLPRASAIPEHWRPMHGDLTPWNLRRDRRGPFLIDWEDADWGPPGADRVYYAITRHAALGGAAPAWTAADAEAVDYWRTVVQARQQGADDPTLKDTLLALLT